MHTCTFTLTAFNDLMVDRVVRYLVTEISRKNTAVTAGYFAVAGKSGHTYMML